MDMEEETIQEFILEAFELIEDAEQSLLDLESGDNYRANYNIVFRAFHSVKGGAGMLGLDATNKLVHFLEDILTQGDKENKIDADLIDFFLNGIDAVKKSLSNQPYEFELISPFENKKPKKNKSNVVPIQNSKAEKPKEKSLGTIFHVDDEAEIGEIVVALLESQGYKVVSFTEGEKLLEHMQNNRCELVIADYKMPEMNGIKVLEKVQELKQEIPVILLSGFLDSKTCIEAVQLGAYALLEKPINTGLLYAICNNAIKAARFNNLINKSINLLMYQFSDLENFLIDNGKEHVRDTIKSELELLISERHELRELKKNKKSAA